MSEYRVNLVIREGGRGVKIPIEHVSATGEVAVDIAVDRLEIDVSIPVALARLLAEETLRAAEALDGRGEMP